MTENPVKTGRKHATTAKAAAKARASLYELEADALKALANPKRLLILDLLSDEKERNVSELQEATGLSQSNLSQNLAVMRTAGLLTARREGNLVYYSITDPRVLRAVNLVRAVMEERIHDRQFTAERAAAKSKERLKRSTVLTVTALLGLLTVAALAASFHPVFAGGTLADVPAHTQLMFASNDLATLVEVCANAMTEPPSGAPSPAPVAGDPV